MQFKLKDMDLKDLLNKEIAKTQKELQELKLHLPDVSIAKRTFCLFPDICGFKGVKTKRCSYKGECEYKTKKAK